MEFDRLISQSQSVDADMEPEHTQSQLPPTSIPDNSIQPIPSETSGQTAADDATSMNHSDAQDKEQAFVPTAKLGYAGHVILLVLVYNTLAIFAWVILCILSKHPMTTNMGYSVDIDGPGRYGGVNASLIQSLYTKNEDWLQAAQVIRSIVGVLTIPLTSAVCSKAAVTFVQQNTRRNLTLRQTMVLADRGWTDPLLYFRILAGGLKKYGTIFLVGATLLNILGAVVTPLQTYFLTTATIKTPTYPGSLDPILDIVDKLDTGVGDFNLATVMARSAMTSADLRSPQSNLWTQDSINCTQEDYSDQVSESCRAGSGSTLTNMTKLTDPFLSQLPSGYSTGLIRQYLFRVNSTAHREIVSEAEYPLSCESLPGAFFARYGAKNPNLLVMTGWGNWSLEVCMPADLSTSPWRVTRKRQDFVEELYLNISLGYPFSNSITTEPREKGGLFRITLATTAGYFELPNYMNSQKPGPLLDVSPLALCKGNCYRQSIGKDVDAGNSSVTKLRRDSEDVSMTSNSSLALERRKNRGPLTTITLALFGTSSFIAERMNHPDGFWYPNQTYEEYKNTPNARACVGQAPFLGLLRNIKSTGNNGNGLEPCLTNEIHNHDDVQGQIMNFVRALYYNSFDHFKLDDDSTITNGFTAAAFLTNQAWLLSDTYSPQWKIHYDMGADTLVPVISKTGIIVVSVLLGIFLASLLSLAIYSALIPRWTDQFDAFAILRLGASLADDIQLRLAHNPGDISVLDTLPGYIGDATDGEGPVGELALGAQRELTGKRKYAAYDVKH